MKTIDLHIIDIIHNSIKAGASEIIIRLTVSEKDNSILLSIEDNACGISEEMLEKIRSEFYSSRKERNVGMGLALLNFQATQTGGYFDISSQICKGTKVVAKFVKNHIDCQPIGDIAGCVSSFICQFENINFSFEFQSDTTNFQIDTEQLKTTFEGIVLNQKSIINLVRQFLADNITF